MGLLTDLNVNPADVSLGGIEKKMASGDLPPVGVHHAVLNAVGPIPNADGAGWKMTFEIIAGPGKGATVEEVLWRKSKDDIPAKNATLANRILLFGHRLGLLNDKLENVPGKHDFCDCLGAQCFIEVKHEEREYTKDGKTRKITEAKLEFNGLLKPDDKKVKDIPKASGAAASAAGKAAAQKPKDNYESL